MARQLLTFALLFIVPFSGMRVICLDPAAQAGAAATDTDRDADCDRICAVHPAAGSNRSSCALTADASALMVFGCAAVLPAHQPMRAVTTARVDVPDAPPLYLEPSLAQLGPPPKS